MPPRSGPLLPGRRARADRGPRGEGHDRLPGGPRGRGRPRPAACPHTGEWPQNSLLPDSPQGIKTRLSRGGVGRLYCSGTETAGGARLCVWRSLIACCRCPVPGTRSPRPAAHCPVPTARCPLPCAHCLEPGAHFQLPGTRCPLPGARYSLPAARNPLPTVWSLLPTAWSPVPAARNPVPASCCPVAAALGPLTTARKPTPGPLCPVPAADAADAAPWPSDISAVPRPLVVLRHFTPPPPPPAARICGVLLEAAARSPRRPAAGLGSVGSPPASPLPLPLGRRPRPGRPSPSSVGFGAAEPHTAERRRRRRRQGAQSAHPLPARLRGRPCHVTGAARRGSAAARARRPPGAARAARPWTGGGRPAPAPCWGSVCSSPWLRRPSWATVCSVPSHWSPGSWVASSEARGIPAGHCPGLRRSVLAVLAILGPHPHSAMSPPTAASTVPRTEPSHRSSARPAAAAMRPRGGGHRVHVSGSPGATSHPATPVTGCRT